MDEITELLRRWQDGDRDALDRLIPHVYGDLRRLAQRELGRRSRPKTLQPTVLVHEAYMKLEGRDSPWKNRGHFFAVAARAMRQIVIDHVRRCQAQKRGGEQRDLALDDALIAVDDQSEMLLALDEALDRLARLDPRMTQVVECRFFAGLSADETAEALGVTRRTVHRDWVKAQALLKRDLVPATG